MAPDTATPPAPLVALTNVTKRFAQGDTNVVALQAVNLTLQPGQLVALHGPSGSGKTTLLNLIAGLDTPDIGTVVTCGLELNTADNSTILELRRSRIGHVFQTFGLLPLLSAAENVEIPFRLHNTDPDLRAERVGQLLEIVGLTNRAHHRPHELSGGEQQRVAIARALAIDPDLLLADEPTAQVDTETASSIVAWLHDLVRQRHLTVLLATHDPDILAAADHTIHLRDGVLSDTAAGQTAKVP